MSAEQVSAEDFDDVIKRAIYEKPREMYLDAKSAEESITRYDLVGNELVERDTGEFVVYTAYQEVCIERDMYKAQAEINAQTVVRQAHVIRRARNDP